MLPQSKIFTLSLVPAHLLHITNHEWEPTNTRWSDLYWALTVELYDNDRCRAFVSSIVRAPHCNCRFSRYSPDSGGGCGSLALEAKLLFLIMFSIHSPSLRHKYKSDLNQPLIITKSSSVIDLAINYRLRGRLLSGRLTPPILLSNNISFHVLLAWYWHNQIWILPIVT